ncbi:unnamed protein product [Haemonchus placei]|uniref:glucuronosyltransferase n=1 Tax=Haemonchus placei TaxID=6290 RepID=A0A0N4VX68_HAEPC|nr:unnamed protein product [Haemonchus placei]
MMEQAGEMNFYQRTKSLIGHGLIKFFWRRLIADPETALFREMISADFPDLLDLASKCPLIMANTNDFYEIPRPTLAKVVNIGGVGMTTRDVKPLPKDIEKIMQKGNGVVLFSFGSVAAAHQMPQEWKVIFMEAFKKLPNYQFLVRYEKDDLNGNFFSSILFAVMVFEVRILCISFILDMLPENVHLFQWLPQSDILQHPKTKAFITHGGYNSVQVSVLQQHWVFGLKRSNNGVIGTILPSNYLRINFLEKNQEYCGAWHYSDPFGPVPNHSFSLRLMLSFGSTLPQQKKRCVGHQSRTIVYGSNLSHLKGSQ